MPRLLSQPARLWLLAGYTILLFLLSRVATDNWIPAWDHRGLWFYSGAFAFLTGTLIEAPTHVVPRQSLLFSVVALLAILGFGFGTRHTFTPAAEFTWLLAIAIELFIATLSVLAIVWKDHSQTNIKGKLAATGYEVSSRAGKPATATGAVFLFALVAYHWPDPTEVLLLAVGWAFLVFGRPLETLGEMSASLRSLWAAKPDGQYLGNIVGHAVPGVVTIRHSGIAHVQPGTPLIVRGDDGSPNVALALSYIGFAEGLWLRALQLQLSPEERALIPARRLPEGSCGLLRDPDLVTSLEAERSGAMRRRTSLIGLVAKSSDTKTLRFELVRDDLAVEEGRLVEARIGDRAVLYQILGGLTCEDVLQQKNTRGFVVGQARKVGSWSQTAQRFDHVPWVPEANAPVFLCEHTEAVVPEAVGVFPGSGYPVFADPHQLVTHNTAVLGILGVGKTFLALELVERILKEGIRVICLDLTNQYSEELLPWHDPEVQQRVEEHLQAIGKAGKDAFAQNVEEGGSVRQFEAAVRRLAKRFLAPDRDNALCIVNPNTFEVWRQDSKLYQGRASMAALTAAEITRLITEAALDACQELGMTTSARCCLVYEEAHSLIPEWSAVAAEGDKSASNGTARAILQGRKFGLGCIVVTQRTASVTKTILNQCNTVFAMRTFDATGMEFLSNYIGTDYTQILSTLADRRGVVFGKASSCADPILVRFNDRDTFLTRARWENVDAEAEFGNPVDQTTKAN